MSKLRITGTRFNLIDDTFERKVAEMEPATPPQPVNSVQMRKGPWTGNNQLGYKLPFAPDADNRQTVLKLDEWGFPEIWTVSLGIEGFTGGGFSGFAVKGILNFGVGGSTQTIETDWRNGTQISLVMNALNIIAEFQDLDVCDEGQGLFLTVQVSRGNRPGGNPPVSTMKVSAIGMGAGAAFPVGTILQNVTLTPGQNTGLAALPPFANKICVAPASSVPTNIANVFSDDTRLIVYAGNLGSGFDEVQSLRGSDLQNRKGIDVTGSARFALFINGSATENATITMWSELAG